MEHVFSELFWTGLNHIVIVMSHQVIGLCIANLLAWGQKVLLFMLSLLDLQHAVLEWARVTYQQVTEGLQIYWFGLICALLPQIFGILHVFNSQNS